MSLRDVDYQLQTVKIDLIYTLLYINKRFISYFCKCNLWLAAESGSSFLMNKNAFATVLSTLEPEKFLQQIETRSSRQVASALDMSGLTCLFLGFSQDLNVGQVLFPLFLCPIGTHLFQGEIVEALEIANRCQRSIGLKTSLLIVSLRVTASK